MKTHQVMVAAKHGMQPTASPAARDGVFLRSPRLRPVRNESRRALAPLTQRQDRPSAWAADQVYLAHFALADVAGERHNACECFSRGSAGLAGAQASPYRVRLEDWSVEETAPGVYHMQAAQEGLALDLTLTDEKGPILQGDRGYSQKGPDPGNASYYYSLARLASSGTVRVGDAAYEVNGLS